MLPIKLEKQDRKYVSDGSENLACDINSFYKIF